MIWILCILVVIAILVFIIDIKTKQKNNEEIEEKEVDTSAETTKECPYYKAMLLTKNEWYFYINTLKPLEEKYNIKVLPKVRMEDVVGVKKTVDKKERASARGKVKSRHFDFVITNPNLKILLIIELDDRSHETEKAIKNDEFKNSVLNQIGIPYIRITRNDSEKFEDMLCETLKINKKTS